MKVLRDHDYKELDLKIVVTERVWRGAVPPAVGDDAEGVLWLQGRLWQLKTRQSLASVEKRYTNAIIDSNMQF